MPGTRRRSLGEAAGEVPWWAANKCISLVPTRLADGKRRVDLKVPLLDSWTLRRFVDAHCRIPAEALDPWRPTVALVRRTCLTKNTVTNADTVLLSPYNATHHLHFSVRTPGSYARESRKTEVASHLFSIAYWKLTNV